jgi:hypothetical protein
MAQASLFGCLQQMSCKSTVKRVLISKQVETSGQDKYVYNDTVYRKNADEAVALWEIMQYGACQIKKSGPVLNQKE